jgi:uncharacterized protein (TIGR02246 family)
MIPKTTLRRNALNATRAAGALAALALALIVPALRTSARAQDASHATSHPSSELRINGNLSINQIVTGFSDGWNHHDAAAMCASLDDNVQWTNWRGETLHTRKEVQDQHAMLFSDLYKNTKRTDEIKSITYLRPDLASVDDDWTMTGAKARDGSEWPYRAGYVNFLMERRGNRWIIIVSHTADFNAKAPAPK